MAKTLKICLLFMAMPLASAALAERDCRVADQDSGELKFSGVAEDTPFRGQFGDFQVRVCLGEDGLTGADIEVQVRTASADVGNREGNEALKEVEFFAVERFPEANWTSSSISACNNGYRAEGELSIKGISAAQPVDLELDTDAEPWRLAGRAEIMRLDWQVGTGEFDDPDFIRNRVDLSFSLELLPEIDE